MIERLRSARLKRGHRGGRYENIFSIEFAASVIIGLVIASHLQAHAQREGVQCGEA
jgi:hypothetical protein